MAHIMVVDDQPLVRLTVRMVLEQAGHSVIEAGDGGAALRLLDRETIDLLIADVVMPEVDGITLVKKTRSRFPDLPVLAISGGGGSMPAAYGLKMTEMFGANQVLYKPFTPPELLEAIATLLSPLSVPAP